MNDAQERLELRQIQKAINREEYIEALKEKHNITGTRDEQKELIEEKKKIVDQKINETQG